MGPIEMTPDQADKPFNPAVGDTVIAVDASGKGHSVTVVRGPWRGQDFVLVTIRFDSGTEMPWPLKAVRPVGVRVVGRTEPGDG